MNLTLEEVKGLENQLKLEITVLNRIRETLALETDPASQVKYEHQIEEKEGSIQRIKEQFRAAYDLSSASGQSILKGKIRDLDIQESIGKLHLVNCNREGMMDRFWKAYDNGATKPFHYYFISSCPTQMPNSFAERMVYEYIYEEMEDQWDAIYFPRLGDEQRPKVYPFPLQRNLINSQNAFRTFFREHFDFGDHTSFEDYLQSGLPDLGYDAVALFFTLEASRWKHDILPEYFKWLFDLLQNAHSDVPKFHLFFAVNFSDLHTKTLSIAEQQVLDDINTLARDYSTAVHLSPLIPVDREDVNIWFREGLGVRNQADIDDVVDTLVRGLKTKEKKQAKQKQTFNMDDLERMQKEVYDVMNE